MLDAIAKPFGWLLMWLYEFTTNYGVAVILFALIVKVILLPFQMKSKRSMMNTSRIQPKIKELEKKHGANKQKFNEEVQKLYKEEKINPMSGCLWSLLPFPILIALYQAIRMPITIMMGIPAAMISEGGVIFDMLTKLGFTSTMNAGYVQIAQTQFIANNWDSFAGLSDKLRQIDYSFLGIDLGAQPQWNFLWTTDWSSPAIWGPGLVLFIIPIISAALGFISSKISTKMNGTADQQQSMGAMLFLMPLISLYIGFIMPAALGLYWIASTLFSILQDIWLTKRYKKIMAIEDADRLERERIKNEELEAKRRETERLKAENKTKVNPNTSRKKQQLSEREEQRAKSAEWEKRSREEETEPSRVGERRYARGRAYVADRYDGTYVAPEEAAEEPDEAEKPAALEAAVLGAEVAEALENEDVCEPDEAYEEADEDEPEDDYEDVEADEEENRDE